MKPIFQDSINGVGDISNYSKSQDILDTLIEYKLIWDGVHYSLELIPVKII